MNEWITRGIGTPCLHHSLLFLVTKKQQQESTVIIQRRKMGEGSFFPFWNILDPVLKFDSRSMDVWSTGVDYLNRREHAFIWDSASEYWNQGNKEIHVWDHILVVVPSLSRVQLGATPWTAACQASLSFTISQSLLKLLSSELVMPSNHLTLCIRNSRQK